MNSNFKVKNVENYDNCDYLTIKLNRKLIGKVEKIVRGKASYYGYIVTGKESERIDGVFSTGAEAADAVIQILEDIEQFKAFVKTIRTEEELFANIDRFITF